MARVQPHQRRLRHVRADARIVAGLEILHAAVERRRDRHRPAEVQRAHAVVDGIDMLALQAHQTPARDLDARAARRLPLDVALEHGAAEVEPPRVAQHAAVLQVEALAVQPQRDALAVGHAEHELVLLRKAIRGFRVVDRLGVVQAVDVAAILRRRTVEAFLVRAAQADVAVAEREQRLGQCVAGGVEVGFAEAPGLVREHHAAPSRGCARPSAANTCSAASGSAKGRRSPTRTSSRVVLASNGAASSPMRR